VLPAIVGFAVAVVGCSTSDPGITVGSVQPTSTTSETGSASSAPGTTESESTTPLPSTTTTSEAAPTTTIDADSPRPEVGQCRPASSQDVIESPTDPRPPVQCGGHGLQTVAVIDLAGGDYPSDALDNPSPQLQASLDQCDKAVRDFAGIPDSEKDTLLTPLRPILYFPSRSQWTAGEHWMRCDAALIENGESTAPIDFNLQGAWGTDDRSKLLVCLEGPNVLRCSEPHTAELFAIITLDDAPTAPYPGTDQLQSEAAQRCQAEARRVVGADRQDLDVLFGTPSADDWDAGSRLVRCALQPHDGSTLKGTLRDLGTAPLPKA
jgi:hypothetical protein